MDENEVIADIARRLLTEPRVGAQNGCHELDEVPPFNCQNPPVPSAVLIGLVQRDNHSRVLYIERSSNLRHHAGQIAFPGGKIDQTDGSARAAALREAQEEVGLNPDDVDVIGYLPNYLSGTNFLITPVVGIVRPTHEFVANPDEVAGIFEVPLKHLIPDHNYSRLRFMRHDQMPRETWRIDYDDRSIWGITASMTRMFREIALTQNKFENG